jgi:hypothetical protein
MTAPTLRRRGSSSKVNAPAEAQGYRHLKHFALWLLTITALSGCATGHLYPIQGPLASQTPPPIYKMAISGALNSGSLSTTLPSGEICQGTWGLLRQDDPTANKMSAQWDLVYGPGFFVGHVLGNAQFARASLTGNQGTTLAIEFYKPGQGDVTTIKGIAQDNKGNLFKLTF